MTDLVYTPRPSGGGTLTNPALGLVVADVEPGPEADAIGQLFALAPALATHCRRLLALVEGQQIGCYLSHEERVQLHDARLTVNLLPK